MGAPFCDITLFAPTPYANDVPEYLLETALMNYISDLYVSKMQGYKPPFTTRVSIQPAYYSIWNRTWKNGSNIAIATEFIYNKFVSLDKQGKYAYILDIIHSSMLRLSDEYNWDRPVFEKAYNEVLANNFNFSMDYPVKMSRDRNKSARIIIEKSETVTTLNVLFRINDHSLKIVLLRKKNWWWYDSAYLLAKNNKWFDNERFGVAFKPVNFAAWYSLSQEKVSFEHHGQVSEDLKIESLFQF